jgi:dTDP-4-dehydrorhamnose 3,5-epimerase
LAFSPFGNDSIYSFDHEKWKAEQLTLKNLGIEGVFTFDSPLWTDERGTFREWFRLDEIVAGRKSLFQVKQSNFSTSQKGVVRGIHFSKIEFGQSKLITCVSGRIFDVVVDLNPNSVTFGKWVSVELSKESGKSLHISPGLGHAFLAMEENSIVVYSQTTSFEPRMEFGINPFDADLKIEWPKLDYIVSDKDLKAPSFKDFFGIE